MKKTGSEIPPEESEAGKAAPAEPAERARLQAEVAKQRVRIAKEELKRARKRLKEAKREARRARKQAASTRKVWKKAQRAQVDDTGAKAAARGRKQRGGKRTQPTAAPAKGKFTAKKVAARKQATQARPVGAPSARSQPVNSAAAKTARVTQTTAKRAPPPRVKRAPATTRSKNASRAQQTTKRPTPSRPQKHFTAPTPAPVETVHPENPQERPTVDSVPADSATTEQKP
jgi:hypothetical protein